jgi:hypothetical protein
LKNRAFFKAEKTTPFPNFNLFPWRKKHFLQNFTNDDEMLGFLCGSASSIASTIQLTVLPNSSPAALIVYEDRLSFCSGLSFGKARGMLKIETPRNEKTFGGVAWEMGGKVKGLGWRW